MQHPPPPPPPPPFQGHQGPAPVQRSMSSPQPYQTRDAHLPPLPPMPPLPHMQHRQPMQQPLQQPMQHMQQPLQHMPQHMQQPMQQQPMQQQHMHQQPMQQPMQPMLPRPPVIPPPGAALVEELDERVMVQLGDGSKIIGILRCIDVHGNFVMEKTMTRHICGRYYHDEPRGLELIRGENVVLMGRLDPEREPRMLRKLELVSKERIVQAQEEERLNDQMAGNIQRQFDFLEL